MTKDEAFEQFSCWYQACIESGLEPEEVVSQMGGMALVTDDELVDRLKESGAIPSY